MISLNFYKNVPFSPENNDVILDVQNSFETYLENFFSFNAVLDDWFDIIGSEEAGQIDVSFDNNENVNPDELNYCSVFYYDTNENVLRKKCFFFSNFPPLSEKTYRMFLTIDYWQSYFIRRGATSENGIEIPEIKNALVVQGHGFNSNNTPVRELVQIGESIFNPVNTSLITNSYRLCIHATTESNGLYETVFVSTKTYNVESLTNVLNFIASSDHVTLNYTSPQNVNVKIISAYAIPSAFFPDTFGIGFTDATFSSWTYDDFYIMAQIGGTGNISTFNTYFTVTPQKTKLTMVGTLQNRIELKYNGSTFTILINLTLGNDISLTMICDKQILEILNDFQVNVVLDEYTSYMSQSKNQRTFGVISKTLGAGIGLGSSLITGNPLGAVGSVMGVTSVVSDKMKMMDMDSKPANLQTDTNTIANLKINNGFGTIVFTPLNHDEILKFDHYFGFGFNEFMNNVSIVPTNDFDRFRYIKCSELSVLGNFSQNVKTIIENYFKRGIRIWFSYSHFLDSMNPNV